MENQVQEILTLFPGAKLYSEGGFNFIFIPEIELPTGCIPDKVEALLCYQKRDGYESRLFFSRMIAGGPRRNWNAHNVRILGKNWFAISWRTNPGLTILQMLFTHINAFQK